MSTLDLQPDIYQRYSVVARIAAAVRTALATTSPLRVLDIGCGPVPLTAQFLYGWLELRDHVRLRRLGSTVN